MSEPLLVVDASEIREGKLEEIRAAVAELAAFVDANEADPIAYRIYFSKDGRGMTVVQVHPDSASMEHHMDVAGPLFARFADMLTLRTVDVYGTPSDRILDQLRQKTELLGTATIQVHDLQAGFARFGSRLSS